MKALPQLLLIGAISVAAAGGTYWIKGPPSRLLACDPFTLKPDEVCLQQVPSDSSILWVDARPRVQWEKDGVAGSTHWDLESPESMMASEAEVAARLMETPRVVVYCSDENCGLSRQVADRIRALGIAQEVHVLRGGWRALKEAGKTKDSSRAISN